MSERIKVEIEVSERVKYHRYVEMTREDFEKLESALHSPDHKEVRRGEEAIRSYIRAEDANDWDQLEIDTFRED